MAVDFLTELLKWFGISLLVGIGLNVGWAIIFWNSPLFMWHWIAVPASILTMIFGGIRAWRKYP